MRFRPGLVVKAGAAGFTLLEVLLAVTILGMAYLAIMQNFSMSMRNIDRLARNDDRLFAARAELEKDLMPGEIGEEVAGEVFTEGGKYVVMRVVDEESGKLETLCLKEI